MMRPLAALAAMLAVAACGDDPAPAPVGVLLPRTGPASRPWDRALALAAELIEAGGGPRVELRVHDTGVVDATEAATELLADDAVVAVIGPDDSDRALALGRRFVDARLPLVTPSATSAELFHAYGGAGIVWRTVEPDVAQVRVLLELARDGGAGRVALLASTGEYGATFFDWFGFTATELGLEPVIAVRDELSPGGCASSVDRALDPAPDALLIVPADEAGVRCAVVAARGRAPDVALLLPDIGRTPSLLAAPEAEGVVGADPAAAPDSAFPSLWRERFGEEPPAYAATTFDALLFVAFGLEGATAPGRGGLARALTELGGEVGVGGDPPPWRPDEVARSLGAIRDGGRPPLGGATGPLVFDSELGMDRVSSTYRTWRVEGGRFVTTGHVVTPATGVSSARTRAGPEHAQDTTSAEDTGYEPAPQTGRWALIAAVSSGWENYRHQADALAVYRSLRARGLPDDRIVLVLADDLTGDPRNPDGAVRAEVSGPDLRAGAEVDHRLADVDAEALVAILRGDASTGLSPVIDSGPGDDVLVFLVGHGGRPGLYVGADRASDDAGAGASVLDATMLAGASRDMRDLGRFRRLLFVVEMCHGAVLGAELSAPGALLLTGAGATEDSLATRYDPALGVWLADQLTAAFVEAAEAAPEASLAELYGRIYLRVSGSHATVANHARFGPMSEVPAADFLGPDPG